MFCFMCECKIKRKKVFSRPDINKTICSKKCEEDYIDWTKGYIEMKLEQDRREREYFKKNKLKRFEELIMNPSVH